ncbi:MAG: NAD-dependent succinate-semialdehyde dehydrogenase [Flammeovirgaceae bacterium]
MNFGEIYTFNQTAMKIYSINPYNGEHIAEYDTWDIKKLENSFLYASSAYKRWKKTSLEERASKMLVLSEKLLENKIHYARLISLEMGKLIQEAIAEVEKCASVCKYYAENASSILEEKHYQTEAKESYLRYEPIGAVLGIMPWNFPFWQVFRYAVPVMMAGNVTLLKHAPNVWSCALALEQLFEEVGFPKGVFQSVFIEIDLVEKIISNPLVQGVTFTGSEKAGRSVASLAGKYGKKSVLELGGSDAFVVLKDADLNLAAKTAVQSRMANAGQTCIAAKRWIVEEVVADDFIQLALNHISSLKIGNPLEQNTTFAPMARLDLAENVERQYWASLKAGAKSLLPHQRQGTHYSPNLITNVLPSTTAFEEEIFGPLAVVISAQNETEAIDLANQTSFGLGASLWTKDLDKVKKLVPEIDAGSVFVNSLVKSDPRMPFGGIKRSGYGRELGVYGLYEFSNIKTVWMNE